MTNLAIIGHPKTVLGHDEYYEHLIPLEPKHAPKLKELKLGYYFVQDDLLDFLVSHSSTLEVCDLALRPAAFAFDGFILDILTIWSCIA